MHRALVNRTLPCPRTCSTGSDLSVVSYKNLSDQGTDMPSFPVCTRNFMLLETRSNGISKARAHTFPGQLTFARSG